MKFNQNYAFYSICLLLIVVTTAVYWQVQYFGYIDLDDNLYVYENKYVRQGLTTDSVVWAFTKGEGGLWIPLTWVSLMIDYQLFGDDPGRFHVTNLILHVLNSILILLLLWRLTKELLPSTFVAALFALHPLHVESVVWITERKDCLSVFFLLLAVLAYIDYARNRSIGRYSLSLFFFILATASKPVVVTFPVILLLVDYWPLGRMSISEFGHSGNTNSPAEQATDDAESSSLRYLILEKVPMFLVSVTISGVTVFQQKAYGAVISILPLTNRVTNAVTSYVRYIENTFIPHDLAVFYPHPWYAISIHETTVAVVILLTISWYALRKIKAYPYFAVGWLWFLITLLPNIGLIQAGVQARADRFTYIPSIGLFIIVSWGLQDLLGAGQLRKRIYSGVAVILLVACCCITWRQIGYWRNSEVLFRHTLSVTIDNAVIHNNLGLGQQNKGRADEAISHYLSALSIKPDYPEAHYNLGIQYWKIGQAEAAERQYKIALRIKPDYASAYVNLGVVARETGRVNESIRHFNHAIAADPNLILAYTNLGTALRRKNMSQKAIGVYHKALDIDPNHVETLNDLGNAYKDVGNFRRAFECYSKALEIEPKRYAIHYNFGIALVADGQIDAAMRRYKEAIRVNPEGARSNTNLSNIYANRQDYDRAITAYMRALKIDPELIEAIDNLKVIRALQRETRDQKRNQTER